MGRLAEHECPTGVVDDQRDRVESDAPAHALGNGRNRVEDSRDEDEDGQCNRDGGGDIAHKDAEGCEEPREAQREHHQREENHREVDEGDGQTTEENHRAGEQHRQADSGLDEARHQDRCR